MRKTSIKTAALLLALLPLAGYAGKKTEKIGLAEKPVPVASVRNIQGFVGQRIALNRDVYLKNFPIDEYVDFVVRRQHRDWNWTRAEQHGKWLESAYLSAIQSGDQELLKKAQSELYRIIEEETVGRKLDFLIQEFNRECNTVCSKSNDALLTSLALKMKNEIEKVREQIQNLE